ncbi:MAG TPA: AI-2E family transporter [Candidatus Nealsonbacteria bacterium]|uniref:AI-2E family transporter n=1 Tax=marine sediment metagenome TaxID=412755 RepID=A0A0F9UVI0_9ZZZZ|nr:AI-2E family transporter [Candidatus Nealsonbacteria bacterium]HEB46654.1 AI-2E family transporter [Candidatus Nealsonbacteria bacterium]
MNGSRVLDISLGTIFKIAFIALLFYIIYLIRDILILSIFALIISILFNPIIDFLQRKRIPRVLAVIFVYIGIFGLISLLIYSLASLFFVEIQKFSQGLPEYFETISPPLKSLGVEAFEDIESFIGLLNKSVETIAASFLGAVSAIFGGIFSTIYVVTIAIFLSLEEKGVEKSLSLLFPKKYETYVLHLWARCQRKVSGWFLSRILASIFVGGVVYVAFLILNVKYPLTLGLLAGVLNFIPIIGPIVTGILIFVIISLDSTLRAIFALVAFTLVQQIENNILTPLLTKRFVALSPVIVLISLVIGGKLLGILGAIFAIPLAGILSEFLKDFLAKKKEEESIVL